MASVNSDTTLSTGTNELRNSLYARNLYAPDTQYPLQNQKNIDKVVGSLNTVIKAIKPFSSYDLTNTVYGRLITTETPLTRIGLEMLGKQFALNSMSRLAKNYMPTMKIANLFDGSKDTKLFTKSLNFRITKKEDESNLKSFLNNAVHWYPAKDYPFDAETENSDIIKNTGTAQLNLFYNSINRNIYKQNDKTLYEYAEIAETQISERMDLIGAGNKIWYNFNNKKFDPYAMFTPSTDAMFWSNHYMVQSGRITTYDDEFKQEYAPTTAYIDKYFGVTNKTEEVSKEALSIPDGNTWIDKNVEFRDDAIQNKVIWGLNGTTSETKEALKGLRPGVSTETYNSGVQSNDLTNSHNIRAGLLEYTRNLVNASEGRIGDITRKAFVDKDGKITGFQGSGLWKSNESVYATARNLAGKSGTRQHTQIDQYDRFAKAIRFNGNQVYNGNPNSVIYKTVLPKIHPIMDENNKVDNTDMMFSIENLAVKVISNGDYGIIDDEYGSAIPLCEVGPFGGRLMWFPPYNLEINESASAKYEPTVMIGRNEPMYNYMYSERNATLSFSLLIDYPEQLKNFSGGDRQREIAEFFAFGGEEFQDNTKKTAEDLELKIKKLQEKIKSIEAGTVVTEPDVKEPSPLNVYFPNDVPRVDDDLISIINKMYNTYKYEIVKDSVSSDGGTYGLNSKIYVISGITEYKIDGKTYYSASTVVNQNHYGGFTNEDPFGLQELNVMLDKVYCNEENRVLYDINIVGAASKLYTEAISDDVAAEEAYNEALGTRRARAVEELIDDRLFAMYGKDAYDLGITVNISTTGSYDASEDNATAAAIPLRDTKEERSASIAIERNLTPRPPKEVPLSEEDRKTLIQLKKEKEAANTELKRLKGLAESCVYEDRPIPDSENGSSDTGILHGFKGVSDNYFQPVFHSQTPEDFHKRLTFLQQCTRQGSSKKYDLVNENGNLRAKNSVFGRQPICIIRVGDFIYSKVVLETLTIDYADTTWDMNPEGFGMQPMIANVTLNMKLIGGQSLKGPIDALQNANSYNFYANSNFTSKGMYILPAAMAEQQAAYRGGIETANSGIIEEFDRLNAERAAKREETNTLK